MANRYAVANGNFESTATWDGGTLPSMSDDVYANGFTVALNISLSASSLRTESASGISAGGGFSVAVAGLTVNANLYAGSTRVFTNVSYTTFNGTFYGGATANIEAAITQAGCIFNGDSYGRFGSGLRILNGGVQNGNSYGSETSSAIMGTNIGGGGVQNGNCYSGISVGSLGTQVTGGGWFHGQVIARRTSTFALLINTSGRAIVTGLTRLNVNPVNVGVDSTVICMNGVDPALALSAAPVFSTNVNYPFINPPFNRLDFLGGYDE